MSATTMACVKCGGSGKVSFKHIENGKCFRCDGTGNEPKSSGAKRSVRNVCVFKYSVQVEACEPGDFVSACNADTVEEARGYSVKVDRSHGELRSWRMVDHASGKVVSEWSNA